MNMKFYVYLQFTPEMWLWEKINEEPSMFIYFWSNEWSRRDVSIFTNFLES